MRKDEKQLRGTLLATVGVAFLLALTLTLQFLMGTSKGLKLMPSGLTVFVLITVNLLLVSIFVLLIGRILVKLWIDSKKGLPGTRFSLKLVVNVLIATIVPALFLFFVAVGFINKSVETWFSERREELVNSAKDIATQFTVYLEKHSKLLCQGAVNDMKREKLLPLNKEDDKKKKWRVQWILKKYRNLFGAKFIDLYFPDGQFYFGTSAKRRSVHKELNIPKMIKEAFYENVAYGFTHKRYYCYIYPNKGNKLALFVAYKLSKSLSLALTNIQKIYQEFSSLKLIKESIKITYIIIFLMISALIIFASAWYALQIAKTVTVPLEALMNATEEVSRGNLNVKVEAKATDELGQLIEHFNRMVADLNVKQKELEQGKVFIETVIESITTGVISINRHMNVTIVNSAAKRILGIKENVINKKYWIAFPEERFSSLYKIIRNMIRKAEAEQHHAEVTMHIEGTPKHLLVKASPIINPTYGRMGVVIVIEDITELVKAQRAQAWEEVARRMAHEIKNPLTPVKLSAQRIKRKIAKLKVDPKETEALMQSADVIIRSVETISRMVSEFSRFAKLPETQLEPCNVRELIEEVVDMYRGLKDIDFEVVLPENLPEKALLDRDQMKAVFMNLIENAIDAMGGKGKITIRASYKEKEKRLVFEVADTGCGIPDEDKEKLFVPYFSKKKGGTGLGLAIVDKIVADHDGYIRVGDNHPKGAIFTIEIPYREAA